MDFMSYRLGHSIQSDIIFGTSEGEITTFCAGKHFVLKAIDISRMGAKERKDAANEVPAAFAWNGFA